MRSGVGVAGERASCRAGVPVTKLRPTALFNKYNIKITYVMKIKEKNKQPRTNNFLNKT